MTLGHHGVNTLLRFHAPNSPSHQDACVETTAIKTDRGPAGTWWWMRLKIKKYEQKDRGTHNIEIFALWLQSEPAGRLRSCRCGCQSASLVVSDSSLCVPGALSHHRNALRGAVQGRHHVEPLHASQYGAQRSQSGALLLGPVREERVGWSLATPKQIQLFGLVAQCYTHLPPSLAPCFLQEPFHLFLPVGGEIDVQPVVLLAVPVSACGKQRKRLNFQYYK